MYIDGALFSKSCNIASICHHHPRNLGFQFQLNDQIIWIHERDYKQAIAYILLGKLNYGYHN